MTLITTNEPLTMGSLEIAKLCDKNHADVMRDIKNMLKQLDLGVSSFADTYINLQNKQTYPCYNLDKELSLTLVAGYNVKLRNAIIKRWQELENITPALPNFTDPAEAAIAGAGQYKQNQTLQIELKAKEKQIEADSSYTGLGKIMNLVDGTIKVSDYAIMLQNNHGVKGLGQNRLFEWLRENGYLCKSEFEKNRPTQKSMELKLFTYTETLISHKSGKVGASFTPRITGRGQVYFVDKIISTFKKDEKHAG